MVLVPAGTAACLFDLDGVLTKTAKLHAEAWKRMFDGYLRLRAERGGDEFRPFDTGADYETYVDGKSRYDGVRSFLASRGIELAVGDPGDAPSTESVAGLGNRRHELVLNLIRERGARRIPARCASFVRRVRAVCRPRSFREVRTAARSCTPPASNRCSTPAWTG